MKPEYAGVQEFSDMTGFSYTQSSQILVRRMGDKRIKDGKTALYPMEDLTGLANYYINGRKPQQPHELSRKDIMKQYRVGSKEIVELIAHEDFPKPCRTYIDMEGSKGNSFQLWDSKELEDIDVYELLDKDEPEDAVKLPFVYYGFRFNGYLIVCPVMHFRLGKIDEQGNDRINP